MRTVFADLRYCDALGEVCELFAIAVAVLELAETEAGCLAQ